MLQANKKFLDGATTLIAYDEGASYVLYRGARTERALRQRLANERNYHGRRAEALLFCHAIQADHVCYLVFDDQHEDHVRGPTMTALTELAHADMELSQVLDDPDREPGQLEAAVEQRDRALVSLSSGSGG